MTREDQDDCVSRQAVIETLKESKDVDLGVLPTGNRSYADIWRCVTVAYEKGLEEARKRVECMPSAQPERKKGKWEKIEVIPEAYDIAGVKTWASKMRCNQCGFTTFAIEGHFAQYDFCPNCGSYNGGEQE